MSLALAETKKRSRHETRNSSTKFWRSIRTRPPRRRAKHLGTFEEGKPDCGVKSNIKSIPGVMTIRGCAYAGSKGVVWGPIKDMVHISHGPVGCGQYSWAARRNYYIGTTGVDTFVTMQFTSDFQEKDIVFGGDKKLAKIMDEIQELFPLNKGITVQSECPIGLIGDDIEAVSKAKSKEYGGKTIVPVRCEGFRGVSQSLGHHIANDVDSRLGLRQAAGKPARFESTPYDVAIIGDYNIGGDAWSSRILLEEMGLRVIAQWSGDGTHRRARSDAQGQAQRPALLPLDELHLAPHGREVRHSVGGIQLLRPEQDRRSRCAGSPATSTTRSRKAPSASSPSIRR